MPTYRYTEQLLGFNYMIDMTVWVEKEEEISTDQTRKKVITSKEIEEDPEENSENQREQDWTDHILKDNLLNIIRCQCNNSV